MDRGNSTVRVRRGAVFRLGDFDVDRVAGRLRRGDIELSLRAKSFALLCYLADNPGRLIMRDELLRAVWPGAAVSPGVVRISIGEVREALGDDPTAPRFIETVGRQGYRFRAEAAAAPVGEPSFVGRTAELAQLHRVLQRCRGLQRQVIFVSGEAGIGKTALVDRFTAEVRGAGGARFAQGHCIDLHGSTEPYQAVLEMLGHACREDSQGEFVGVLDRWAPSWLLQMPGVVDASTAEALRRRVATPTRDRMLRELADALDVLAKDSPLVLVLEDLHWADASTVDLLAYVAERTTPTRLLVVGTYRPVDAVLAGHPLRTTVRHLIARGRAVETAVELLTVDDVETYLVRRLAGAPLESQLSQIIYTRTDGNPLFLRTIVDHLLENRMLTIVDGRWQLARIESVVPPSLRGLVAREVEMLSEDDRQMVAAASVVGVEFDAISVAAAAGEELRAVEERCARLVAGGQLIQATGMATWPDGSIGGTYKFQHALHRDVVYNRLADTDRARLHRMVGERLEAGWVSDPAAMTAILAAHFECGHDWPKAIRYHIGAVQASKARLADREAVVHSEAVLSLLGHLRPSSERDRTEMTCALSLGSSLLAVRGYGTPKVKPLFARARDLAVALEQPIVEMIARGGLYTSEAAGGHQRRAMELAGDLMAMAGRFPLPLFVMIGHTTLGASHYNLGNLPMARRHFECAGPAWAPDFPRLQLDQKVLFLGLGALVLQQLGEVTEGDSWIESLIEYAGGLDDPMNATNAFGLIGSHRMWAGDRDQAVAWAERAIRLAVEHGFPGHEAGAKITKGYALGDVAMQRDALAALQATGNRVQLPTHRMQIAKTLVDLGRWDEAGVEIDQALSDVAATGEARHVAEIHRVRALCLRAAGQLNEAAAALHEAIAVARLQEARRFEEQALADLAAMNESTAVTPES